MKIVSSEDAIHRRPLLIEKARLLAGYTKTLTPTQIAKSMKLSSTLANKTADLITGWSDDVDSQTTAIDSFKGDIYSGLQAGSLNQADRVYADQNLRILSGLYGIIRPLDGIAPYRLEMGYKLPSKKFSDLYKYWGDSIADTLPDHGFIVNVSAEEYTRVVLPYIKSDRVITPRFLTKDQKTGDAKFVVVHTKIARGAFARWMIVNRIEDPGLLPKFDELGYVYNKRLSTTRGPVFICDNFGGLGLSVRLK